jgi:hypothetical protein
LVEETLVLAPKAEVTMFARGDDPYEAAYAR